jgi:hypothetical protein
MDRAENALSATLTRAHDTTCRRRAFAVRCHATADLYVRA